MLVTVLEMVHRTRQHHAIEHATLHVLAARHPTGRFVGYSDPLGFMIYGDIDEDGVRHAVGDALLRLQAGEHHLARHPNCGTNLVTLAVLLALVVQITSRKRNAFERFIVTLIGVLPVLIFGRSVGDYLQGYTTQANVSDRWVADIQPTSIGGLRVFRVLFE